MSTKHNLRAKYRPVLTQSQINHILHLCRRDSSNESLSVIGTLAQFEYKILQNAVNPAYTSTPNLTLSESLGFDAPAELSKLTITDASATAENLYQLWMLEPASLTVRQLQQVREYRYTNNKMTVDEEAKYESELLKG